MNDLIKVTLESAEAPEGNRGKRAVAQLPLDRMPGENGKAAAGKQSLLDRFRAAELHGYVERVFRPAALARKEARERPERARTAFPRDKSSAREVLDVDGLPPRPRMPRADDEHHFVLPELLKCQPAVAGFEADEADIHRTVEHRLDDARGIADFERRFHLGIAGGKRGELRR